MRTTSPTLLLLLCCAATALARAGTNGFIVPVVRGSANSQAGYWETFTAAVGAPGNRPDKPGATTAAVLTQSHPNALLTGSGNIYNPDGASRFTLVDAAPTTLGTVVLQTRTIGSELDYASVTLTCTNGAGPHALAPLSRVELNRGSQPGLGATVSSLWQWDLSGLGVSAYAITFHAAESSVSFDAMTLDTGSQFTPLFTPPFVVNDPAPVLERWMYANNAAPCDRPAGATFGTFGEAANVDTRHAQHLVGWDTASLIPPNRGPASYLVRRCRLTVTINRGGLFAFDPTPDDFRTYSEADQPNHLPDADVGRPLELFGVGYRNGYTEATFDQCAPFGSNAPAQRNAYAAGFSTHGELIDLSNNVGKTSEAFPPFEVVPFAVGQTTAAAPGELVPAGARFTFDLNLNDPFVLGYVQAGLDGGRLRLMLSSLHVTAGQFGTASYPDFATRFNDAVLEPTRLELEGVVVGQSDVDADGLPDDWELFSLQTLTQSGTQDPDGDGASNLAEFRAGTDPASAPSALRIVSIGRELAGPATLRFPQAASRRYALEFTEDFAAWQRIAKPSLFYPDPTTAEWTDDGSLTGGIGPRRFYRIVVEAP